MATLELRIYGLPAEEVWDLTNPTPHWVESLFAVLGSSPDDPAPSALMDALKEKLERRLAALALVLRKAELRGWATELRGDRVRIASGLAPAATRQAMEADGVWHLALRLDGRLESVLGR